MPTNSRSNAIDNADKAAHTTTLNSSAGYVTMINTYTVTPDRAEELLSFLKKATEDTVRHVPGFVSANLHMNFEKTQIVNYAQWVNGAALVAARDNTALVALMQEQLKFADTFTPMPYGLRVCIPAAKS